MKIIHVAIPDELVAQLRLDEAQLARELRWLIAAKPYELGRLSAGVAAEMVGVSRVEFLNRFAEFCVSPINPTAGCALNTIGAVASVALAIDGIESWLGVDIGF